MYNMNFVQIRAFDNYISAHITLGMLQDAGINCHLQDEYMITLDPLLSPAIGGMKLMVYPSQVQRAAELLEETEREA
jgi:Putative prokaryotic signal transducing protein